MYSQIPSIVLSRQRLQWSSFIERWGCNAQHVSVILYHNTLAKQTESCTHLVPSHASRINRLNLTAKCYINGCYIQITSCSHWVELEGFPVYLLDMWSCYHNKKSKVKPSKTIQWRKYKPFVFFQVIPSCFRCRCAVFDLRLH